MQFVSQTSESESLSDIDTSMAYLLTSESAIKTKVVKHFLALGLRPAINVKLHTKGEDCSDLGNVEQPVGIGGLVCCKNRIIKARQNIGSFSHLSLPYSSLTFVICKRSQKV